MSVLQYSTLESENQSPSSNSGAPEMLFDERTLKEAESSEYQSLVCLANCVYLVNSTILRERRLLPDAFFKPFPVYGDVIGYIVDQSTDGGKKLSRRLNAVDSAIRRKRILKLAIVVEPLENEMQPVETFVWNFSFGTHVSARIGCPGGNMAEFVVDYENMDVTCREFCKLFQNLQKTFESLLPLPFGMVPSLKVAHRGDSEFSNDFLPVDEFVNMEQIGVGQVSFPFKNGFHLSHASEFSIHNERRQESLINEEEVTEQNTMEFDVPMSSPTHQTTQNDSMICEANVESQEIEKMTPSVDIPEKLPVLLKKSEIYEFEDRKPKKRSARNLFTKKPVVDDDSAEFEKIRDNSTVETVEIPQKSRKFGRVSTIRRSSDLEGHFGSLTIHKEIKVPKIEKFGRVSTIRRTSGDGIIEKENKKFGRVSSVLASSFSEENTEVPSFEQLVTPKREKYARVASLSTISPGERRMSEETIEDAGNFESDSMTTSPQLGPIKQNKEKKFGKVASVLRFSVNEVKPKTRKYARVTSVKNNF